MKTFDKRIIAATRLNIYNNISIIFFHRKLLFWTKVATVLKFKNLNTSLKSKSGQR